MPNNIQNRPPTLSLPEVGQEPPPNQPARLEPTSKPTEEVDGVDQNRESVSSIQGHRLVPPLATGRVQGSSTNNTVPPAIPPVLSAPQQSNAPESFRVDNASKLKTELADVLHADWQATARASGRTERFKPVKDGGKAVECHTPEKLQVYLDSKGIPAAHRNRYRIVNGKIEEDILAILNRHLAANNRGENDASASVTIELITQQLAHGGQLDAAFIEQASRELHNKWVERNGSWAPEEQKLPFDKLSKTEADKDRDMIRQGIVLIVEQRSRV